jgi:hypothetical protein
MRPAGEAESGLNGYLRYRGTMNSATEPRSIEEALDRYWVDRPTSAHVPDYANFDEWMTQRFESLSRVPLPLHSRQPSSAQFWKELLRAAEAGGIKITADDATPDPVRFAAWDGKQSRLKRLNKSKLLLWYFKNTSLRWRQMLKSLSEPDLSSDLLPRTSSQSAHRVALFKAIANGDQLAAFKLVGRLRDEEHDPGEVAFLEATVSFHSNRFDEAIGFAREVPTEAIDWPRAFMLLLESYGYLGDVGSIEAELRAHPEFLFPEYFLRYVFQITIENSSAPEIALKRASKIIRSTLDRSQPGPGAFQMWNRHSCQVAVRFIEQLRDANVINAALHQTGVIYEPYEEMSDSLAFQRNKYALFLDQHLLTRLSQEKIDKAYKEIVKRLMNHGSPGRAEYFEALTAQWRIGEGAIFLDNVLASMDNLIADSSTEARQMLVWGYQEAKLTDRGTDAELLRRRLVDIPSMAEKLRVIENANSNNQLEQSLSPMGQLALRSANLDLAQALKDDLLWKDEGTLSLGFFRIIELEVNERLVLPALENLDIAQLEVKLNDLRSRDPDKSTKGAIGFWERMLPQLRRSKDERKGLELGALELLLSKTAKLSGPDIGLKSPLHAQLLQRLTPNGAVAFKSGKLTQLVEARAREKFRNPPAHCRYVGLSVARECKQHVENVLRMLLNFTIDASDCTPTMH